MTNQQLRERQPAELKRLATINGDLNVHWMHVSPAEVLSLLAALEEAEQRAERSARSAKRLRQAAQRALEFLCDVDLIEPQDNANADRWAIHEQLHDALSWLPAAQEKPE